MKRKRLVWIFVALIVVVGIGLFFTIGNDKSVKDKNYKEVIK